jgi:hypothetical protein
MKPGETQPLWRELVGDTEPWRKGRIIVAVIIALDLVGRTLLIADWVIVGNIDQIFVQSIAGVIALLLFYFIWIGIHWVRFVTAAWLGLVALFYLLWGFNDDLAGEMFAGGVNLVCAAYLALSAPVFFFAKHQRESPWWRETLVFVGTCVLLTASLASAIVALAGYRNEQLIEARNFADSAFGAIFADHDTYFFLGHVTEHCLQTNGGRLQVTRFLQDATLRAGDAHDFEPARGKIVLSYNFPTRLDCTGMMETKAVGMKGPIDLHMKVVEQGQGWQIENIWWRFERPAR